MHCSHLKCGYFFFFNDTATTEIYTLSLHDALPIYPASGVGLSLVSDDAAADTAQASEEGDVSFTGIEPGHYTLSAERSEEHTSELQSRQYLVCRLLLEKKKKHNYIIALYIHHISAY